MENAATEDMGVSGDEDSDYILISKAGITKQ